MSIEQFLATWFTNLKTALKLGRSAIGVDVSSQYLGDLVPQRVSNTQMEIQF